MQEEYIYIGCEFGTYKTDMGIVLNKMFNPKLEKPNLCRTSVNIDTCSNLENIYKLLTDNDKKLLGWDKNFEKRIIYLIKHR